MLVLLPRRVVLGPSGLHRASDDDEGWSIGQDDNDDNEGERDKVRLKLSRPEAGKTGWWRDACMEGCTAAATPLNAPCVGGGALLACGLAATNVHFSAQASL